MNNMIMLIVLVIAAVLIPGWLRIIRRRNRDTYIKRHYEKYPSLDERVSDEAGNVQSVAEALQDNNSAEYPMKNE